ncbi:hypothetical protein NPIL_237581 [Nephila pilipes]|uniref:Uncharacterized protein n=1 Tax=Nephila pilipes TaxID=299642 RepID=A0A8X6R970_NEPPI|nr:hypothetical protein NPIL_237581 [Nephila pilipes]
MDTDNDDASNPSLEKAEPNTGESLHLFIKMLNLDAINIELETAKFSSDIFKICILLDEKLNQLDSIKFSSPQDKSELFEELNNLLEKARCKFHTLKTNEIASEVSFFKEVSQAWGMNTENKNEFKEVKKSKKKSSPIKSQQPKRQKTERTTELKNKFQALSSSDEEMQSIPSSASTQPSNLNQPSTSIHGQIQNQSQESNLDQTKKIKETNIQLNLQKDFPPLPGHATTGYPHVNPTEVQLPIMSQKEPSSSLTDTLENLRNPQVKEIFELLDQAIAIATSDLSKYQKMRAILKIAGEDLGI